MKSAIADFRRAVRTGGVGLRICLWTIVAILALSFLQLILTVAFVSQYTDWFLNEHGWATADDAPDGEVLGIYLGIGLRCVFSLFWIFSFGKLIEVIASRSVWSLRMVVIYGVITMVGYGYWTISGGPTWLTTIRVLQTICGAVLLALCLSRAFRRSLAPPEKVASV